LNLSLAYEYVGDITIPTQVIKNNQCCSRRIQEFKLQITYIFYIYTDADDYIYQDTIQAVVLCPL
jgi:hypothetical protein